MRNAAGLFLGSVIVFSTGCVAQVTDSSGNGGSNSGTGASGGSSSGVGTGGTGGTGTAGVGGAAGSATAGAGGTSTAGAGGTSAAGTGGTATAGTGGTATAGTGGTTSAGTGGTTTAGSGGTTTAGAGGTTTAGSGGTGTAGTTGKGGGAGTGAGGTGAGGSTGAVCYMRIAHLACDAGGTVDICIRAKGIASWTDASVQRFFKGSGDPDAFFYPAVSIYFEVDEGDYEVRMIDNTATDCATPYDAAFDKGSISVKPGAHYTLALEGKYDTHSLFFQMTTDDANPTDSTVGFQALNALTDTPGSLNFCLQKPGGSINTVTTNIAPLGPAKSQTNTQTVPTDPPTDDRRALMFLDNTDSKSIAISDYRLLYGDDEFFAFVAGRSLGDADPNYIPQVISCLYDSTNAGTTANPTIAASCGYFKQTTPSNP